MANLLGNNSYIKLARMNGGGMGGSTGSGMGGGGMGGGGMGGGSCAAGITGNCGLTVDAPATPGRVTPDIEFFLSTFMMGSQVINGVSVPVWGFNSGGGMGGRFPAPAIRVRQGQIVHTHLNAMQMMAPHTIHHHGIEPSSFNDGVGHYSFDVLGSYTYQWRASQAGTYFYHCHVNTVLHAEMGMYGALIIDPPTGPGTSFVGGPAYNVEAIWAVDDIDPSWHCLPWNAALCGGDARLNNFNPTLFCINGLGADLTQTDPTVAITIPRGQTLLLRYIMAGYVPQRIQFPAGIGAVTIIAEDGRPLKASQTLAAGGSVTMTAAERYEFIIKPTTAGTFPVDITYFNYRAVSGSLSQIGTIRSVITVT